MARAIPSHLLSLPTVSVSPPVSTRVQELPFGQLTWENFEKLCIRLALAESTVEEFDEVRPYGVQGDDQEGIDLFARLLQTDGRTRYRTYQCKKVESFGPSKIKAAVRLFIRGKWRGKSDDFVLCTSEVMASRLRTDMVERQRRVLARFGIKLVLWDSVALNQRLKTEPEIVGDFFGREWVRCFCGENLVDQDAQRIISQLSEQLAQKDQILIQQTQTISQLSQAVVNLSVPPAPSPIPVSDVPWASTIERAERWSESLQLSQVHGAQELVAEVRQSPDFESLSTELRVRTATVAGKCAFALGDIARAAQEMEEALRLAPNETRCLSNAAAAAMLNENFLRAIELAEKALVNQPDNLNAALVLVQAWAQEEQSHKIKPFIETHSWFLESEWGLASLAHMEILLGNYDLAYNYAKQALTKNPDHVPALDNLSEAVFLNLRNNVLGGTQSIGNADNIRLEEAEKALTHAASLLQNRPNIAQYHRILCNRAALRNAREQYKEALEDCNRVLFGSPSDYNQDFATFIRGLIHMKSGQHSQAIEDLEKVRDTHLREESAHALAHCYQSVGRLDEAILQLESLWHPETGDYGEFLLAEMLLRAHREREDRAAIEATLKKLEEAQPNAPETLSIQAYEHFLSGDLEPALALMRRAIELNSVTGVQKQALYLRWGEIYYAAHQYSQAADAWQEAGLESGGELIHNSTLDYYRNAYVCALYYAKRYTSALSMATAIRESGRFVPSVAAIEAVLLIQKDERSSARELFAEILRREPRYLSVRLNAIQLEIQDELISSAHVLADGISYDEIKDDAESLRRATGLLAGSGWKDSLKFAYRARQIDFGNPESHRLYVQVFIQVTEGPLVDENGTRDDEQTADVLVMSGVKAGTVPCSIRLWPPEAGEPALDGSDGLWHEQCETFTIWPEAPHDRARGVFAPSDPFAHELLSLNKGDYFSHQATPLQTPKQYRVAGIIHPYFHAFQETTMRSQEMFPDQAPIQSINVKNDFEELKRFLKVHNEGREYALEQYRQWIFPLYTVGIFRSTSIFDVWLHCIQVPNLGLHAMRFAVGEFEALVVLLQSLWSVSEPGVEAPQSSKPTVVLDFTALMTLVFADVVPYITAHMTFVAPSSLKSHVVQLRRETQKSKAQGFLGYEQGQFHYVPVTEEGRRGRLEALERLLHFLDEHTELANPEDDAPPLNPSSGHNVEQLRKTFGEIAVDALLLARERNLSLYCDDAALVRAFKSVLSLQATPTQPLLAAIHNQGFLNQEEYNAIIDRLNQFNFRFTHVDVAFFQWLIERDEWLPTSAVKASFRQLHGPLCPPETSVGIVARVLKRIYLERSSVTASIRRNEILSLCLESLITGRENSDLIDRLEKVMLGRHEAGLGMAPIQLKELREDIKAWKKAHYRIY